MLVAINESEIKSEIMTPYEVAFSQSLMVLLI